MSQHPEHAVFIERLDRVDTDIATIRAQSAATQNVVTELSATMREFMTSTRSAISGMAGTVNALTEDMQGIQGKVANSGRTNWQTIAAVVTVILVIVFGVSSLFWTGLDSRIRSAEAVIEKHEGRTLELEKTNAALSATFEERSKWFDRLLTNQLNPKE